VNGLRRSDTGSPAIAATTGAVPAGNTSTSISMTPRGWRTARVLSDERKESAVPFLERALAWFAGLGVSVQRVMTDNGSAYRSHHWRAACRPRGCATSEPSPTPRAPKARPSGSAKPACASGPTRKASVEGFSIRSVRLRHHRGPVYTVPFSLLGAIQNQSRDWVIDKIAVGVTYDSDLEKARKLIKQIGLDLQEDLEFAPLILEPLKMQGVEQLGDFAVQIRAKMMTVPGEQFVIRRKAYAMIKKAFDENGIKFAFPTVQVAGETEAATAAVAQHALGLTRPVAAG